MEIAVAFLLLVIAVFMIMSFAMLSMIKDYLENINVGQIHIVDILDDIQDLLSDIKERRKKKK